MKLRNNPVLRRALEKVPVNHDEGQWLLEICDPIRRHHETVPVKYDELGRMWQPWDRHVVFIWDNNKGMFGPKKYRINKGIELQTKTLEWCLAQWERDGRYADPSHNRIRNYFNSEVIYCSILTH